MPFDSYVNAFFVIVNCLLKHKATESEKHHDFYFLVGIGWGMEGVGTGGDSPEGKLGTYL